MVTEKQKANLMPPPKKGEVRNPKGKPKGSRNFRTVIREFLDNVDVMIDGKKSDGYMALVATLYKKATTHEDVSAIKEIIDRLEGKAVAISEVTVNGSLNTLSEEQLKDIVEKEKLDDKRGTSGLGIDKTPTANGS